MLATVTRDVATKKAGMEVVRHSNVVPLVHDDVPQSIAACTAAVGERSLEPNSRPLRVAVDPGPPEKGALPTIFAKLTTGAVKGNECKADIC